MSSRGRCRAGVIVGIVFIIVVICLFHSLYYNLDKQTTAFEKCHQHEASLSTQLQVVYEHKTRLEKSLQQEKWEHKKTRDELINRAQEEKEQWQRDKLEAQNQFSSSKQQYLLLKTTYDELRSDFDHLTKTNIALMEEKSLLEHGQQKALSHASQLQTEVEKLQRKVSSLQQKRESDVKLIEDLKQRQSQTSQYLTAEKEELQAQLQKCLSNHKQNTGQEKEIPVAPQDEKAKISSEANPVIPIVAAPPDKNRTRSREFNEVDRDEKKKKYNVLQPPQQPQKNNEAAEESILLKPLYNSHKVVAPVPRIHEQMPPQGFLPIPPGFENGQHRNGPADSINKRPLLGPNWNRPVVPHRSRDNADHQLEQPVIGIGKRYVDIEKMKEVGNGAGKANLDYDFDQDQIEESEDDRAGYPQARAQQENEIQRHDGAFQYLNDGVMVQPK